MKRVAYFGTQGGGTKGHYFTAIVGDFTREEEKIVEKLDGDNLYKLFNGKRSFQFFTYAGCMGLAAPCSPDDSRGGSKTIVLVENATTEKEVLEAVEASSFLKSQFNRLSKMYGIPMPDISI